MELDALIERRRSVRAYQENVVIPKEDVEAILRAAQMGPTWKNSQTARYYAVMSEKMVARVRDCLPAFNQKSSANAIYIVTTFVKDVSGFTNGIADNEMGNEWGAYDLGQQSAYLILKAADLGYDTLIMGLRDHGALRAALEIPENEQVAAVIALGKRSGEPLLRPRKELGEVARFF